MLTKEAWHALDAKADWEGGWPEYILGYGGVSSTPALKDDLEFFAAVVNLEQAWTVLESYIENYIKEYGEYE